MNLFRLFLLLGLLGFIGCNTCGKEDLKFTPSDYLIKQRSYPFNAIDLKAYRKAVQFRASNMHVQKGPFDIPWQSLGPTTYCGRVTDIEMPINDQRTIFVGSASGGIFKTSDFGDNWSAIFDDTGCSSIGDMSISRMNPEVIYVGTGEANAGGGSLTYDGNGIYVSTDSGNSWEQRGLDNVGSIGKVAISNQNDATVYVAAMGSLFKNNAERGIYKTVNGGLEWTQVLYLSDSTGGIDLAIHPQDDQVVYAAMWERTRRVYDRQYGGATSGIYRSLDGGDNWQELTNGLPQDAEEKGRIGIAISESDPMTLYAMYANTQGSLHGIFKTVDGGETWEQKSSEGITDVPFIWWFGKIIINPLDANDLYATSLNLSRSQDGGTTWEPSFSGAHVDHHALFVHPTNQDIVLNGNDGGVYQATNENSTFEKYLTGFSNFQFYTCTIDPNDQTVIYGGAQDNGTNRNTQNGNWELVRFGDGFKTLVEKGNSNHIYTLTQNGGLAFSNDGGQTHNVIINGIPGRFNWNTPIALDPNNQATIYVGNQRLYKSRDRGESWEQISPRLVNESNPSGVIPFGTLTSIDVSTLDNQIIYIGTDDGNAWVTLDGGASYSNLSDDLPNRWVTSIKHDPLDAAGVYLTLSGFRFGESASQVFYSSDYGSNWTAIGTGLPDIPVNDILVDPLIEGFIFVATDIGVYFSNDKGQNWDILGNNLPPVPFLDLDLHVESRTLVAASYGRGMYKVQLPFEVNTEEQKEYASIKYWPNPARNNLVIEIETDYNALFLRNIQGQEILKLKKGNNDISSIEPGLYYIVLESKGKWEYESVMKI